MASTPYTEHPFSDQPPRLSNFLRFIAYVKPYKWSLVLAVIGGAVKFTLPLVIPQITRHLLDAVFLNPQLTSDQKLGELLLNALGVILAFVFIWTPFTYGRH